LQSQDQSRNLCKLTTKFKQKLFAFDGVIKKFCHKTSYTSA